MISSQVFKKACTFTLKGVAWILYAAFLEYCVNSVLKYFLRDTEDGDDNDTVFFTEHNQNCWLHVVNRDSCGEDCAYTKLRRISRYMETAQHTLDVCIYQMSSYEFALNIINAHKRGVNVRVITDGYRVKSAGSQINLLREEGVPVRTIESGYEMHHKFFVADRKTLVNCSFNWTMQAANGNSEDAIICSNQLIIKKFLLHFDALWNLQG